MITAGGTGAVDTAVFVLAAGDVIRNIATNILWTNGILDCLPHQCSLRRVSSPNGKTRGQIIQKPRYSGKYNSRLRFYNSYILNLIDVFSVCVNKYVKWKWFEVLDGLLGPYWKAAGLAFNCTFLLFGSVIQLIACARFFSLFFFPNLFIV